MKMTSADLRCALADAIMEIKEERVELQVKEKTLIDALKILEERAE